MKTSITIIFLTTLLFFTACDNRVDDGIDKDPIVLGKRNFHIGAEGGKLETKIIKSFFWYVAASRETLSDTVWFLEERIPHDGSFTKYHRNDTIVFENLRLWTDGKKLKAELGPNDLDMKKIFSFGLCKGNRHEGLYITQDGKKD